MAHEIASEIKLTERQQKQKQKEKQQQRGKKGTEDSDNEEEEEDSNSSAEDDDAVVAIAEPDPLAQLYMNMHQANKNASRRTVSAASSANYAGSSSGGSSGGFGGRQGVPFNPSGPLLLSHTGFPAGGVGSGSSSRMGGVGGAVVDMSQDEDGRQCVSLMSPEVPRGRLAASANPYIGAASGSGSGETVVIDLLDDDENDAQQGRPDPRSYNKPLSSTSDPAQGSDYSYNEFADDGDIRIHGSSNQGRNFSSTIVQDESGDFPQTDVFEEAQQVPVDTPSVLTTLRRQEGSGVVDPAEGTALFTKQEMISRANQVWNSAHLAHAPKTVKPAMKFAPSLKKGDSTNSLKRVEERLAMAAVSPTSTAAAAGVPSSSTATAADTEVLGTSMDISAYSAAATPVSSCFSSPAVTACDAGVLETIMDISTNAAAIIAAVPPSSSAVSAATIDAGVLDMSMDISTTACSSVVNSAATATAEDQSAAEVTI